MLYQHQTAGFLQEPPPERCLGSRGWPIPKWPGSLTKPEGRWNGGQLSKAWYLPRQEMTRDSIPCTTSLKFNKMCSTYAVINTFAWGSAQSARVTSTPRGVDCQYEHGHNMPSTGRETAQVSGKLAAAYPRPLGSPSSEGLLYRVHHSPSAVSSPLRDTHLRNKVLSDSGGSDRAPVQRGYRGNSSRSQQLYFSDISCREKRWGVPSGGEPQGVQSICQSRTFQDGGSIFFHP